MTVFNEVHNSTLTISLGVVDVKSEIINLFPTPVMHVPVDVVLEPSDIEHFKNLEYQRYPINNGSYTKDLNVLEPRRFSLLKSCIYNHFYDYLDYLSVSKFDYDWYMSVKVGKLTQT